jgi:hypothetical protein
LFAIKDCASDSEDKQWQTDKPSEYEGESSEVVDLTIRDGPVGEDRNRREGQTDNPCRHNAANRCRCNEASPYFGSVIVSELGLCLAPCFFPRQAGFSDQLLGPSDDFVVIIRHGITVSLDQDRSHRGSPPPQPPITGHMGGSGSVSHPPIYAVMGGRIAYVRHPGDIQVS